MVDPSATPRKSKGKQSAHSSEESDVEHSSGLKEIFAEPKKIYKHTRIGTGAIALIDYNILTKGIKAKDEHSTIAESIRQTHMWRGRLLPIWPTRQKI